MKALRLSEYILNTDFAKDLNICFLFLYFLFQRMEIRDDSKQEGK